MILYASFEKYEIKYSEAQERYFIFMKDDDTPTVGSWEYAANAIAFAEKLTA